MTEHNNTAGYSAGAQRGTHGGRLYIWDSEDLEAEGGPVTNRAQTIDLAEMYSLTGGNNNTGANAVRPHMTYPSPDSRYMALAFVSSGHVAILDAATRRPKALFRRSAGPGGARQAHAATWAIDGRAILVANQNGKKLERINYDPACDEFTHDTAGTLDLANCRTPNGLPCETATPINASDPAYFGPANRPDNAPICPIVTFQNRVVVTLRGGGMFVGDPTTTPMAIVAEYGNALYGRDGCGGIQVGNKVYLNGGAGTTTTNESEFMLYTLEDKFPAAPDFLPANDARIRPLFRDGNAGSDRDAHGMTATGNGYYIWVFDRLANVAEVHRSFDFKYVRTIPLAGPLSADPTPDIVALSPLGNRIYIALRGPQPQTGAHASAGSTPGLGIMSVTHGGASGELIHLRRTELRNGFNGSEESDPHGIVVRVRKSHGILRSAKRAAEPQRQRLRNTWQD
ncbi:MAG: hypothetical protein FJW31_10380 [Acidobacteria bacterium]|nr:hypothetical protein [Acidobacteriota bacterium]